MVELLGQERLAPAVKNQAVVGQDLNRLLELLLSEDRSKRLQSEKERIGRYIQRVNKLIKQQKATAGPDRRRGRSPSRSPNNKAKLAEKTSELGRDIAESEGESKDKKNSDAEPKPAKDKPSDR